MTQRLLAFRALVITLLLASVDFAPAAQADQVPSGSGAYYHVGDNAWAAQGNQANAAAFDANTSSRVSLGSGTSAYPSCSQTQTNFTFAAPRVVKGDLLHVVVTQDVGGTGGGNPGTSCIGVGYTTSDGGASVLVPVRGNCNSCTDTIDVWQNFSLPANVNVTGIWIIANQVCSPCGGYSRALYVNELELLDKNATASDPIRAIANLAASSVQCYATGAAYTNFASNAYTAPAGTFYVMIPAIMPASSASSANPMQVFTTAGGVTSTFYGWSRVMPDITGARSDAVAIWKVTTTQSGLPIYVKPAGTASINATDTVCSFNRVGAMYSSTLSNGYVTAPLTTWGGGANDLWGVVYMANGYPVNSVYDVDLSGTGSLFLQDNMTQGAQALGTGTAGQSTTVSTSALPNFARAGNAFLVAIGQSTTASSNSANYGLQVNGYPAQAIMNGQSTTNAFQYSIFYVDDVAVRNGLNDLNGTVGQSQYRPFNSETFQFTLGSGYDPTKPVYFGNTYGLLGHAGLQCLTLCASNMYDSTFYLPSQQQNTIQFHAQDPNGTAVPGVRVLNANTSSAQLTNANGDAWFNNTFVNTHFTLTKSGYQSLCADFVFRNSPGTTSGTGANACPYLGAFNATFTATMLTLQQANGGSGGIGFLGSSTPSPPTIGFDGNATRTIPDRVAINITRSQSATLFVGADHVDTSTGVLQHNVVRAIVWDAASSNTFNFYYPTRTVSGPQDKGLYVLWVMNDTGVILGYTKYFLEPAGSDWVRDDATITSDIVQSIQSNGYTSAQQSYQQTFQASLLAQQKTVRDQVYEDFQNVHNYGVVFIALLGVLAVIRAFRR